MKITGLILGLVIGATSGYAIGAPDTKPQPLPPDFSIPSENNWWQDYGTIQHTIFDPDRDLDPTARPQKVISC